MTVDFKQKRIEKKLTQTQVAVMVGVSLTSYQLWEKGVSSPNEENKEKLYKVLGVEKGVTS